MTSISYSLHIQDIGWRMGVAQDGIALGTVGLAKQAECVRFNLNGMPEGTVLQYRAHVAGLGWLQWVNIGEDAGTTGQARRLEAIQFRWLNNPQNCVIIGRCHVANLGWLGLLDTRDIETIFGTIGQSLEIEAVQFGVIVESPNPAFTSDGEIVNQAKLLGVSFEKIKNDIMVIYRTDRCLAALNFVIIACMAPVPLSCEAGSLVLIAQCAQAAVVGEKVFGDGGEGHGNRDTGPGNSPNGPASNNEVPGQGPQLIGPGHPHK